MIVQSWRGCLCACASDVCAENFSHSARLLLQQSRASYMLSLCLRAVLISSPDTWDWRRMHALVVIHRRTLCENVDSAKIKMPFYTTDIDILRVTSMHRIVIHCIDISMNHYTPTKQVVHMRKHVIVKDWSAFTRNFTFSYCSWRGHTRYWKQRFTYFCSAQWCNTGSFFHNK